MALVLLVAGVTPAVALYDPGTTYDGPNGQVDPDSNPDFPQLCGVNVILLIDNTQSLSDSNLTDVKNAANDTVDALAATGSVSGVGIISFAQPLSADGANTRIAIKSLDSPADVAAVKSAIGGIERVSTESVTNWEAALLEASLDENDDDGDVANEDLNKPADLVVMISDGTPNTYGYPSFNGTDDGGTAYSEPREAATLAANVLKGEGSRIVGIGFPSDTDYNAANAELAFQAITDGASSTAHTASSNPQEIDYYLLDSSSQVESVLLGITDEFDCGIDVQKTVDANGDGVYNDSQPAVLPNAPVQYRINVTNTGSIDLDLSDYSDDIYGSPSMSPALIGSVLAPGETATFYFDGNAPVAEDDTKVNTYTVYAKGADSDGGADVSDFNDTNVRSLDLTPSISVEKLNDATGDDVFTDDETSALPGDAVTYQVNVTNDGPNNVTIVGYSDDQYTLADGDFTPSLNGTQLAPGESVVVTFEGSAPTAENASKVNTFTVNAVDDDGDQASDFNDTTVRSPDLTPSISVEKLNDANDDGTFTDDETSSMPGDAVTYQVNVTNDGPNAVTIDSFGDDVYDLSDGDLTPSLVGKSLAPGESIVVTFEGSAPANEDQSKTNVFNVTASDGDGDQATDFNDTTVRSPDLTPVISVEKLVDGDDADSTFTDMEYANASSAATYQVNVTNVGPNNVTIVGYSDDKYTLNDGSFTPSLNGTQLAPGESVVVTFQGSAPDTEGASKTNTFTVNAVDDDGDAASANDDATIAAIDYQPSISVEKLVDGDDADSTFTDLEYANQSSPAVYQVNVTNDGPNNVSLTGFSDSIYSLTDSDLSSALTGVELAPGESIVVTFNGSAPDLEGASKNNTFTVNAVDENGDTASDSDWANITAYDLTPSINVTKLVDAQGDGVFADSEEATYPSDPVTYKVVIVNDGPNDVTFDSYSDDIYGVPTLNQTLVGVTLAPGESIVVTFDGTAPDVSDGSKTNVFTATASDENGDEASDFDDATVTTPPALDICPRTPGFWSTHNGESAKGNNDDFTTGLLPIALGDTTATDSKAIVIDSDDDADKVFDAKWSDNSSKSNGITKLYIHLLAAKMNTANGASAPQDVLDAIDSADAKLAMYDEGDWDSLSGEEQSAILDLKDVLDAYNNRAYTGDGCIEDWWQEEVPA